MSAKIEECIRHKRLLHFSGISRYENIIWRLFVQRFEWHGIDRRHNFASGIRQSAVASTHDIVT